jgi:hypothetical protein
MVGSREVLKLLLAVIMLSSDIISVLRVPNRLIEGKGKPLVIRLSSGVNRRHALYRYRSLNCEQGAATGF